MWTSGGAILRDLSRAQGAGAAGGRGLHTELRALRPRDRPPPPPRWLSEETEEYVRGLAHAPAAAGAACEGGPDLRHIQQMLDMVRKLNMAEEEIINDELDSYTIERSRSTNLCRAELPARTPPAAAPAPVSAPAPWTVHDLPDPNKHKKRRRNIALESILEALESNDRNDAINCTSEQFTLLKPGDLINNFPENISNSTGGTDHKNVKDTPSYDKTDSNDKVNHWMNQMMSPTQTKSQSKLVLREAMRLDPSSMFKKKVKIEVAKPSTKSNCEAALKKEKPPGNGSASYVPSADASLCYQRYLENNKLTQQRRDEASHWAALITEALKRAAQAKATELAALKEASERAVLEETSERAALEEAIDRAALAAATERSALEEASERAALEKAPERGAQETERAACVESVVSRAMLAAPAGARLAAPRACLPRAPCLVCERLTHRPAPQGKETCSPTLALTCPCKQE